MKKQDIKRDLIKDRIISGIRYLSDNSNYVWGFLAVVASVIIAASFISSENNKKLSESNNLVGLLQNKVVYDSENNDSLLLSEFENLLDTSLSKESYNQVLIYLLNHSIKSNDKDKVLSLLDNNTLDSDDDMLNAFILKLRGDIASDNDNISDAISYYARAADMVPSYDLMVTYSIALIDLYIEENKLDKANKVFEKISSSTDKVDNLPRNTQNNIDFIEYKLKQMNK